MIQKLVFLFIGECLVFPLFVPNGFGGVLSYLSINETNAFLKYISYLRYWKGSKEKDVVDFMAANYPKTFEYAEFAPMFKAEFYDPDHWTEIFKASGAKYILKLINSLSIVED